LKVYVQASWLASRKTYGSPRVLEDLRELGERVSRKRVARLMTEQGLAGRKKRRFVTTTQSNHELPIAENILERKFRVAKPNRVWAGDITYLRTAEGWLYLAVVVDLFSRRIVGWATGETLHTRLALDALRMAFARRHERSKLLHHSDRGVQYAANDYRSSLKANGVRCSMSRKGNCWDNAVVESFFATLKTELTPETGEYASRAVARSAVVDYIENFYNTKRRHSALGFVSPVAYEAAIRMGRAA
jgi:transposase InsO family protein